MTGSLNRRNLLAGGLWMGVGLLGPAKLLAHGHHHAHGAGAKARGVRPQAHPASATPTFQTLEGSQEALPLSNVVDVLTPYERRVVDVARQQMAKNSGQIARRDLVAIADFARPSNQPRLHFVNLEAGRVESFFVAHGRGSDPQHDGFLKTFSNRVNSEATSRGAYETAAIYNGKYGPSIRLRGLDADNSNAWDRAIVMHPAWYAAPDMLSKYGKLGRSEGCFAMDPDKFHEALQRLAAGRLLFADKIGEA
jgi:hypothetical protein